MLPFASAVEPLRIANRLSRKPLYQWSVVTADGGDVFATNGMIVQAKYSVSRAPDFSMIFVCGPHEPKTFNEVGVVRWLAAQGKRDIVIGGLETGCHVLAEAGLLNNVQCTTHWENIEEFKEAFPKHTVSSDLYEIDGNRVTCSEGPLPWT